MCMTSRSPRPRGYSAYVVMKIGQIDDLEQSCTKWTRKQNRNKQYFMITEFTNWLVQVGKDHGPSEFSSVTSIDVNEFLIVKITL